MESSTWVFEFSTLVMLKGILYKISLKKQFYLHIFNFLTEFTAKFKIISGNFL